MRKVAILSVVFYLTICCAGCVMLSPPKIFDDPEVKSAALQWLSQMDKRASGEFDISNPSIDFLWITGVRISTAGVIVRGKGEASDIMVPAPTGGGQ